MEGIKRYNKMFNAVKKDQKTHKMFTINWLAKRKAMLLDAVQTRKRKRPEKQAQIDLLDSQDNNSGNETGSANINGAMDLLLNQKKVTMTLVDIIQINPLDMLLKTIRTVTIIQ
jgi:hypothetical protein